MCSQIVRITAPDQNGITVNQSAVVDRMNDLVTFSLTSPPNRTSTVLFDLKQVRWGSFEQTLRWPARRRALLISWDVAGFDLLQTRGAGLLLPAADGRDRLRQRALSPPRASAGNQRRHLQVETPEKKIHIHHIRVTHVQTTHENYWKKLMCRCRITYIYEICSLCRCNSTVICCRVT